MVFYLHETCYTKISEIRKQLKLEREKPDHRPALSFLSVGLNGRGQASREKFHLANQLDRDTIGVMIITKSHKEAAKLVQAFTDHKVEKTYIALCMGSAPNLQRISIRSGHGRLKFGAWRVYAISDVGKPLPGGSVVRDMETSFEVLRINGRGSFQGPSRVKAEEEDFIMVEGYVKYEGIQEWEGRICDGDEPHAESLPSEHPVTRPLVLRAPLPSWALQALELLRPLNGFYWL
ncbi:Pseudouridine synthase, RsuA/RluA-like [Dillenia turbinata]|uniref:Pseudouridine synthase, RsuA/RluA-like n=1 Tax=Dillenia turbinata TaxID=194707 RepID=A0AAN8US14_9MAGN